MAKLIDKYKPYTEDEQFLKSVVMAVLFLIIGILITFLAIIYATESASNSVTDIVLSNIKVFDVDGIFIYGPLVFWLIITFYVISEPKKIPFTLKSIAFFLVIRSVFVSLTHMGPFPMHAQVDITGIFGVFLSGKDLFFSSHTGLPFLMALIFWDNKYLKFFCLISSFIFGAVVLMAHLHYSIDVFAAFFITFAIFRASLELFKKDRLVFTNGLSPKSR